MENKEKSQFPTPRTDARKREIAAWCKERGMPYEDYSPPGVPTYPELCRELERELEELRERIVRPVEVAFTEGGEGQMLVVTDIPAWRGHPLFLPPNGGGRVSMLVSNGDEIIRAAKKLAAVEAELAEANARISNAAREHDALDHIMRVASEGVQPTRRLDWIVKRAERALAGKEPDSDDRPPENSVLKMSKDFADCRAERNELRTYAVALEAALVHVTDVDDYQPHSCEECAKIKALLQGIYEKRLKGATTNTEFQMNSQLPKLTGWLCCKCGGDIAVGDHPVFLARPNGNPGPVFHRACYALETSPGGSSDIGTPEATNTAHEICRQQEPKP